MAWVAVAYAFTVLLFVLANKLTTSANAIFLQDTAPLWVLLLSPVLLRERPTRGELLSAPLFLVGLLLFFLDQLSPGQAVGERHRRGLGRGLRALHPRAARSSGRRNVAAIVWGNALAALMSFPMALRGPAPTARDLGIVLFLGLFQLGASLRAVRPRRAPHARPSRPRSWRWSSRCSTRCGPSSSPASAPARGPSAGGPSSSPRRCGEPWRRGSRHAGAAAPALSGEPGARTPSGARTGRRRRAPGRRGTGPRRCSTQSSGPRVDAEHPPEVDGEVDQVHAAAGRCPLEGRRLDEDVRVEEVPPASAGPAGRRRTRRRTRSRRRSSVPVRGREAHPHRPAHGEPAQQRGLAGEDEAGLERARAVAERGRRWAPRARRAAGRAPRASSPRRAGCRRCARSTGP